MEYIKHSGMDGTGGTGSGGPALGLRFPAAMKTRHLDILDGKDPAILRLAALVRTLGEQGGIHVAGAEVIEQAKYGGQIHGGGTPIEFRIDKEDAGGTDLALRIAALQRELGVTGAASQPDTTELTLDELGQPLSIEELNQLMKEQGSLLPATFRSDRKLQTTSQHALQPVHLRDLRKLQMSKIAAIAYAGSGVETTYTETMGAASGTFAS